MYDREKIEEALEALSLGFSSSQAAVSRRRALLREELIYAPRRAGASPAARAHRVYTNGGITGARGRRRPSRRPPR